MVWKKGESGNKGGGKNGLIWEAAIRRNLIKNKNGVIDYAKLDQCAAALVDAALNKDIAALREIGDRLDGKPVQSTVLTATIKSHEQSLRELIGLAEQNQNDDE